MLTGENREKRNLRGLRGTSVTANSFGNSSTRIDYFPKFTF